MEVRGVLVWFAAFAVTVVSCETKVTFPEIARERSSSRIVSGWEADEDQFPFQLSLRMVSSEGDVFSCGGTVIHPEWGLTAAHCTAARVTIVIRAGLVNLTRPSIIFETTKYYNYPDYDESIPRVVQPHDIGLLEFGRALEFNEHVQPIRLQRSSERARNFDEVQMTASGWGRTWTLGSSPENLNWVYLRGVTNFVCSWRFGFNPIIVDSTICAQYYNVTSQSTCQGDSGGPLTAVDDDGVVSQMGVTSFVSENGCHTDSPAGFIRPGYYHDWFSEVTGINFDWDISSTTTVPEATTTTPEATTAAPEATTAAPEEEIECTDEVDEE